MATKPKSATTKPRKKLVEDKKEEPPIKKIGLWDYLGSIMSKKLDFNDDDLRDYDPYIINRWISLIPQYCVIVNFVNRAEFISNKKAHYEFLKNVIPQKFIKIGTYQGNSMNTNTRWELNMLMDLHRLGSKDALLVHRELSMSRDLEEELKAYRSR